jgi:hypothetical protein
MAYTDDGRYSADMVSSLTQKQLRGNAEKVLTFVVPCYNSAEYLDHCVESLLPAGDDVEIILVNDGSTKDDTSEKIHAWQQRHPDVIRAIDQENKGHGGAVNTGLANARGLYFKVVDSDDWLDISALEELMDYLRSQNHDDDPTDMVIVNYVYEKVYEGKHTTISYKNVFPRGREFGWEDTHRFLQSQYILMHSIVYRTQLLHDCGLELPEHCFYVDNIFVYVPLPYVKTMYYLPVDLYRYFIGREDQSVNESVMLGRIDQQVRVTRAMIDAVELPNPNLNRKLERYMKNYLAMMMCICSVFLRMKQDDPLADQKLANLWEYLKQQHPDAYKSVRHKVINIATNLPTKFGKQVGNTGYHVAQKIFKFN